MEKALWGTDVTPSHPDEPPMPVLVDLGGSGFVFTAGGIAHNVDAETIQDFITPNFAPIPPLAGGQ
jgi:hypothetical protein